MNRSAVFVAAALMTACVSTNATVMNKQAVYPKVDPDAVVLYQSADQIPRQYDEVAILNSKGDVDLTNESKMFESMRKKAAELGANGVLIQSTKDPGTGAKVAKFLFGTSANRQGAATAIYVHPDTARAAVAKQ